MCGYERPATDGDDLALHRRTRITHGAGTGSAHERPGLRGKLHSSARSVLEWRATAIVKRLDQPARNGRAPGALCVSRKSTGHHDRGEEDVAPAHSGTVADPDRKLADLRTLVTPPDGGGMT
jgi:hypothetical protein